MENCLYTWNYSVPVKGSFYFPKEEYRKEFKNYLNYPPLNFWAVDIRIKRKNQDLYHRAKHFILTKDQLKQYGYPYQSLEDPKKTICTKSKWDFEQDSNLRVCLRCFSSYSPISQQRGDVVCEKGCHYHKYKSRTMLVDGTVKCLYPCCREDESSPGCQWYPHHISNFYDLDSGSFVSTKKKADFHKESSIYGLDCEMCYTFSGLEVTRVSVVSCDGNVVYERYIRPESPIIDYATAFSGITADHLKDVTITLPTVQEELLQIIDSKTILVGHGLENDLKALKIIHEKVIDTAALYPHKAGFPYRRSLKSLAKTYLDYSIQGDSNGHNSIEDAYTALKLLLLKIQ